MALSTNLCLCESSCWAVPGTETEGWSTCAPGGFFAADVTPATLYVIGTGMADWRWSRLGDVSELFEVLCWKACFDAMAWAYVAKEEEGVLRDRLGPWGAADSVRMCSDTLENNGIKKK